MSKYELPAKERKRIRYSTVREQRKHKFLMVVDNTPIRAREIRGAQGWLKKIDRLDEGIQRFYQTDQRRFNEWHDLTFRDLTVEIAKKREEYFTYADFHNQMILLSKTRNISIPKAFALLYDEDLKFKSGDPETRAKIEEARNQRKEELEREFKKSSGECDCPACRARRREQGDFEEALGDENDPSEESEVEFRRKCEYFASLDSEKIRKLMSNGHESALVFLLEAIPILMRAGRKDLMRKFWDFTPSRAKREFNRLTQKGFGVTFDEMIVDLENDAEDDAFDEELIGRDRTRHQTKPQSESDKLKLKTIYRKIVRRIHPDQLDERFLKSRKSWVDSVWKKSVRASDLGDLHTLTKLYHQILVAFEEFDGLSVAELRSVVTSVQDEFKEREVEAKRIKSSPAWNFSVLKNYSKLKAKMSKPFHKELAELSEQIEELKDNRIYLERLLQSGWDPDRPRRKSKTRRRRPRRRSSRRDSDAQMSFGI